MRALAVGIVLAWTGLAAAQPASEPLPPKQPPLPTVLPPEPGGHAPGAQPPPFTPLPEAPPPAPGPQPRLVTPQQQQAVSAVAGPPPQQQYVQVGGAIGGNGGGTEGVFVGVAAEAGYRIYNEFWLHAEMIAAECWNDPHGNKFDGTLLHVRAGAEWRHRIFFAGTDVGYARERANTMTTYSSFVAALRVGLDLRLAGDVRFRPTFELFAGDKLPDQPAIHGKDYEGGDLSLALAYTW